MSTNSQSNTKTPCSTRRFVERLEGWWSRQSKLAVILHMAGISICGAGWLIAALYLSVLKLHGRLSPETGHLFCQMFYWTFPIFIVIWTLVCFRWRKVPQGDRTVPPQTFLLTVLITAWLSLFMAVSPCTAANSTLTNAVTQLGQSGQVGQFASTPASNNSQPKVVLCELLIYVVWLLAFATAVVIAIDHWCVALGLCGHTGKEPPQSPPANTNQTQIARSPFRSSPKTVWPINTNVGLPAISFAIQNGVVVSNSAGRAVQPFPSFFSKDGAPIEPGGSITSTQPGITVPPSVSTWSETNFYADSNLDPVYPYIALFNYTVLTSTNLIDWQEAYTVVGWANNNPQVPIQCCITYTNGTPMTTNWDQCYLDSSGQVTNLVVYGVLPLVNLPIIMQTNSEPVGGGDDGGGLAPPGGNTNGASGPFMTGMRTYKLTCNTNAIVTQWPW